MQERRKRLLRKNKKVPSQFLHYSLDEVGATIIIKFVCEMLFKSRKALTFRQSLFRNCSLRSFFV